MVLLQPQYYKMFVALENENRFVKNLQNNALINADVEGLQDYKRKKESTNKINNISEEINTLKSEMSEIKNLLQQLVKQNIEPK
jgi:uncharacterized coiled-coil DUF342 family protein